MVLKRVEFKFFCWADMERMRSWTRSGRRRRGCALCWAVAERWAVSTFGKHLQSIQWRFYGQ